MFFERAKTDDKDEIYMQMAEAKRDYDNALNRFNAAQTEAMINLAVFDMKAAMKRFCFVMEKAKKLETEW